MIDSKKHKIGFLLGRVTGKGGISRVTSILTDSMFKEDYVDAIHIISFHKKDEVRYGWSQELFYKDLLNDRPSMLKGFYPALKNLIAYINTNKLDILIATGHNVGPLAVLASWFTGIKVVYWSHSSLVGYDSKSKYFNERFNSIFCNAVISLTETDRKNYQKITSSKKIYQIYNPIDPSLQIAVPKYNIQTNKIISVGRLTEYKNFQAGIEAAKIILEEHPNFIWDIYGSGEYEPQLKSQISNLNLEHNIFLKGHVSNIYDLYNDYAFVVMTSKFEGFPMSLIEGMANHLPLISFDIPTGPNEIIQEGINGFLISPFDIKEMAKKINELLENDTLRLSMSKANAKLLDNFSMMKIQKQWKNLFKEVLSM